MRPHLQMPRVNRLLSLVMLASLGLSGCQVGRTFFQMDSNAPVPFFGVDLLPKRDKSSPTTGVSRFQNETVAAPTVSSQSAEQEDKSPRRWTRLLTRSSQPEQLSLPTTSAIEGDVVATDAPVEDFR